MAQKKPQTQSPTPITLDTAQIALDTLDLEGLIADELIDSIDWALVKQALVDRAKAKFFRWFQSQIDTVTVTNEIEAMALSGGDDENP
jgi:hypothetical protein